MGRIVIFKGPWGLISGGMALSTGVGLTILVVTGVFAAGYMVGRRSGAPEAA